MNFRCQKIEVLHRRTKRRSLGCRPRILFSDYCTAISTNRSGRVIEKKARFLSRLSLCESILVVKDRGEKTIEQNPIILSLS
jgi:hypothetical protein